MYLATLCPIAKSPHHLDDVNCKSDGRETFQRVVSICLSLVCGPSLRRPLRSNRLPCCAIDWAMPSPPTRVRFSVAARSLLCLSARASQAPPRRSSPISRRRPASMNTTTASAARLVAASRPPSARCCKRRHHARNRGGPGIGCRGAELVKRSSAQNITPIFRFTLRKRVCLCVSRLRLNKW